MSEKKLSRRDLEAGLYIVTDYRIAIFLIAVIVLSSIVGIVKGQTSPTGSSPDDSSNSSMGMVTGESLANGDADAIAQLRRAGISESLITQAIQLAQNTQSTANSLQASQQWSRDEWYQWCQIDQRVTLFGSMGNGSLNVHHEFQPNRSRGQTLSHYCPGPLCFFWHSDQKQGHWPWRFVLQGTAPRWKHLSFCT